MDKNSNVRVVGFPKENYDKVWLDTLNDRQRSETALADGETTIFEDLRDFQYLLNSSLSKSSYWWYFLND